MEWRPDSAQHVVGTYEERTFDAETGLPDPQDISIKCEACGKGWKTVCSSGAVRTWIARFAASHLHRDAMEAERVEGEGSLRRKLPTPGQEGTP